MSVLPTFVDTASDEYQRNYAAMRALLDEFEQRQETVRQAGANAASASSASAASCSHASASSAAGPGDAILELSTLAAWGMYNDESPGASGSTASAWSTASSA